jgi:pimeloyl-ACP methyl ester carboxylesterase
MGARLAAVIVTLGLGASVHASTTDEWATSYVAPITQVECQFTALRGDAAACFRASVPVHYSDVAEDGTLPEDAPRLTLAITTLQNFVSVEDSNPLVLIAGGPGQSASAMLPGVATALHLRRHRGIIMIDQRGTGASEPSLTCETTSALEIDDNRLNDPELSPATSVEERLTRCISDWRERGVDFNAFDTRSAVYDLVAIRKGFGIRQWNLHGTSYGGRVVQDAMRIDPDGIRAVVMNSPQALSPHFDRDFAENRARLFEQLFTDCAADRYCHEEFGDLKAHLEKIRTHLADEGIDIYLRPSADGQLQRVRVGWPDVVNGLYTHMNFSNSSEPVARYIHELSRMVDGRLSLNDDEVARIFQNSLQDNDYGMALVMHVAVRCREDVPAYNAAIMAAAATQDPALYVEDTTASSYGATCEATDVSPVDASFFEPVTSDIPALILTGDMDPLTPTSWAQKASETLANGQLVSFRGMAHDIFGTSICAQAITANFLDAPLEKVDDTCARSYRPLFAPAQ